MCKTPEELRKAKTDEELLATQKKDLEQDNADLRKLLAKSAAKICYLCKKSDPQKRYCNICKDMEELRESIKE